jgi:hypothetical protein
MPRGRLGGVSKLAGTHYEIVSMIFRALGAKVDLGLVSHGRGRSAGNLKRVQRLAELPLLDFDHLVEEESLRKMQRDHRSRWNQNLEMSSARVFGNHWSQLTLSWMLAPFPFKRKSERDTFLVDLGKLVENKIFQR